MKIKTFFFILIFLFLSYNSMEAFTLVEREQGIKNYARLNLMSFGLGLSVQSGFKLPLLLNISIAKYMVISHKLKFGFSVSLNNSFGEFKLLIPTSEPQTPVDMRTAFIPVYLYYVPYVEL